MNKTYPRRSPKLFQKKEREKLRRGVRNSAKGFRMLGYKARVKFLPDVEPHEIETLCKDGGWFGFYHPYIIFHSPKFIRPNYFKQ